MLALCSSPAALAGPQQQQQQQAAGCRGLRAGSWAAGSPARPPPRRLQRLRAEGERSTQTEEASSVNVNLPSDLDKEVERFAKNAATTFAPRASGATGKNPAYPGSVLYTVFEVQAWAALVVGGLLSFNLIFPSDEPNIARLLGMWSIWMFTVPSLRARQCEEEEKAALNILFLAIPLANVLLPFVWKSFPFIFTADVALMAGVYAWKGLIPGFGGEQKQES